MVVVRTKEVNALVSSFKTVTAMHLFPAVFAASLLLVLVTSGVHLSEQATPTDSSNNIGVPWWFPCFTLTGDLNNPTPFLLSVYCNVTGDFLLNGQFVVGSLID